MARTLYQRVIADRLGSGASDGGGRPRRAREIDLEVRRSRSRTPGRPVGADTRPLRLF